MVHAYALGSFDLVLFNQCRNLLVMNRTSNRISGNHILYNVTTGKPVIHQLYIDRNTSMLVIEEAQPGNVPFLDTYSFDHNKALVFTNGEFIIGTGDVRNKVLGLNRFDITSSNPIFLEYKDANDLNIYVNPSVIFPLPI